MQKLKIYVPILLGLTTIFGIWLGTQFNYPKKPLALHNQEIKEQKLRQIINFIDYEYVDEVNTDSLLDVTIEELLHKLDPHSSYISVSDVQSTTESLQGSFEGIGIEFTTINDTLTVLRVIENGPSEEAGLKAGDRITIVNLDTIAGVPMQNNQYIALLKGPAGSKVEINIYRPTEKKSHQYNVTRGTILLPSIDLSYLVNDSTGVIKVNRFSETTIEEFDNALKELKKKGISNLILDLRNNPGGLLYAANQMADQFLDEDKLIVFTKNRQGERDDSKATKAGMFKTGKLIVLINENSASASEIVAGALQDNDRATIVGRRSFGKGLVQEEIELKDGSKIRLTTSRYYTPTGRSIQRPYRDDYSDYRHETIERYSNGEMFNADSIKIDTTQEFTTPNGKLVYGGGGIVPDEFVAIDTMASSLFKYFTFGEIDRFAFKYVDENRSYFNTLTLENYVSNFEVSDSIYTEFLDYIALSTNQKLKVEPEKEKVKFRIKVIMARNLFGTKGYHMANNERDKMILRSLELLEQ